jgi:hypothetical protein
MNKLKKIKFKNRFHWYEYVFIGIILLGIVLSAWRVLNCDLHFPSDIARDFLLMEEISQKKIMLIGARSSVSGLFHGPLWQYLNYPAYMISGGNPLVVGWYWVLLSACILLVDFYIAEKLFGRLTAYLFVSLLSVYMVFHTSSFINPHGVMFIMPLYFYLLIRYIEYHKAVHLVSHIIVLALVTQFHIGIGISLILLSYPVLIFHIIKQRRFKHIFMLFLLPIFLINFIVFDVRHGFSISHTAFRMITDHTKTSDVTYVSMIVDRIKMMTIGMEITREHQFIRNISAIFIIIFLSLQIRANKNRNTYLYFVYIYAGFFILSLINKGYILPFYLYPIYPLLILIFASFVTSKYKNLFFALFFLVLFLNVQTAFRNTVVQGKERYAKDEYSWKLLNKVAESVFSEDEKNTGYFVYSPDQFAYQLKYAMLYNNHRFNRNSSNFTKKHITYLVYAPSEPSRPDLSGNWWKKEKAKVVAEPTWTKSFDHGYLTERFDLSEEDLETPASSDLDTGVHFR